MVQLVNEKLTVFLGALSLSDIDHDTREPKRLPCREIATALHVDPTNLSVMTDGAVLGRKGIAGLYRLLDLNLDSAPIVHVDTVSEARERNTCFRGRWIDAENLREARIGINEIGLDVQIPSACS